MKISAPKITQTHSLPVPSVYICGESVKVCINFSLLMCTSSLCVFAIFITLCGVNYPPYPGQNQGKRSSSSRYGGMENSERERGGGRKPRNLLCWLLRDVGSRTGLIFICNVFIARVNNRAVS